MVHQPVPRAWIEAARRSRAVKLLAAACALAMPMFGPLAAGAPAQSRPPSTVDDAPGKTRVFVLSDMGNEPDDQMSFVRLLLYSNELDLEGLVATTSDLAEGQGPARDDAEDRRAYGEVRPNLLKHADGWPSRGGARRDGHAGPAGLRHGGGRARQDVAGAEALIRAADRPDPRPALDHRLGRGQHAGAGPARHVRETRTPGGAGRVRRASCGSTPSPTRTTPAPGSAASSRPLLRREAEPERRGVRRRHLDRHQRRRVLPQR